MSMNALKRFFSFSTRKQLLIVLVVFLLVFVVWRIVQAKTLAARTKTPETNVVQIKASEVVQLQPTAFDKTLPISGALEPYEQAMVSARASGEVREVLVREGQAVRAGQTLALLVATNYQAQADQARAAVESAQSALKLAEQDLSNNTELFQSGFIAKMALQRFEAARLNARSNLVNAQQSLVIAQRNLSETQITAPISGVVAARKINTGETVGAGSMLFTLVNDQVFQLTAPISAEQIGQLQIGQSVALSASGVDGAFSGTVERINPAALAGSRSYTAYIRVNNTGHLRAGMFAQGQIVLSSKPNVLSLPATAIRTKDGVRSVYVLSGNSLSERTVTTGERASDAINAPIEITSGLNPGESVVRMDLGVFKPNMAVEVIADAARPAVQNTSANAATQTPAQAAAPKGMWARIKAWFAQK
jgi:membrane fusion protein, multidrug efflux system